MLMLRLRVAAVVVVCVVGGAQAQVRTETVLPQATDPAISGWLGAHSAAFTPGIAHRGELFVLLHGQGGSGTGALELLRTAAEDASGGYHAVALTYPNDWSPFNVCGADAACPENLRREIVDGVDRSAQISVSRANSIENRLVKLLAYLDALHPGEGWGQYVDGASGQVRWERVALWGHSQGGGNAGVIGKHRALARLCLSAPAADGGAGNPAAWWSAPYATAPGRVFGLCHAQDQLSTKVAFWNALGAAGPVTDVATSAPPYAGTHQLSASAAPAVAGQYHNSVVADAVTPRAADGTPLYKAAWRYMLTAGDTPGPAPAPSRDDEPFAAALTDAGVPVTLRMDVLGATAGPAPHPVALWVHGGGWRSGDHNQVPPFADSLQARGVTIATVGYRLSGQAVFPAQIHDCKAAVRWLRAHAAELEIDPARIGVWGSSAGGHLASLLALTAGDPALEGTVGGNTQFSSGVIACATLFGPTDLMSMQADCGAQGPGCATDHDAPTSAESALLGVAGSGQGLAWLRANLGNPAPPFPEKAALATAVNPLTHLDGADVPLFIAHGDADTVVPIGQSARLRARALAAGVPSAFTVAPGFGHGFLGDTVNDAAARWMGDVLLGTLECPRIVTPPAAALAGPGCPARFTVGAAGTGPLAFAWRRNGAPIPLAGNPTAASAMLVVDGADVRAGDAYDCLVTNACGDVLSGAAVLRTCTADYDCDGAPGLLDIFAFLTDWFGGASRADLGGAAGVDLPDIFVFLSAWFAGC